jgi:hypothetical protein
MKIAAGLKLLAVDLKSMHIGSICRVIYGVLDGLD